jgi:propane monooxygenase coupling protein
VTTFATARSPFKCDSTASGMCGFALMNNQVGVVVAAYCDAIRMIHTGDRTIMFANPDDDADYFGFDLTPVSA